MRIIFIFLDGIGLAPVSSRNPLATAITPTLRALLGGPLTSEQTQQRKDLLLQPIDTTLGVAGLPQSGTGQLALLAGVNAPAMVGRHQPHFPPVALQPLLAERSIFRRAHELGRWSAFANTFTPGYWQALANRRLRRTASVIAAEGAGVRFRDLDDWRAGRALMWDITGEALVAQGHPAVLPISPDRAGEHLAVLARTYDLVFFECFLPDLAGHGRLPLSSEAILERIDRMLGGVLAAMDGEHTLVLTSDHGNIEDRTTPGHTRNPVPLLVVGPAAQLFAAVQDSAGVADSIIAALRA